MPNEFGTVFELGVQRLETLEELEIQYSQPLAKPNLTNSFAQQVIRSTHARSDSYRKSHFCLPVSYRFFIAAIRSIETNWAECPSLFLTQNSGV